MKSTITFSRRATPKFALLTLAALLMLPVLSHAASLSINNAGSPTTTTDTTPVNIFSSVRVTTNAIQVATVFIDYSPVNVGSLNFGGGTTVGNSRHFAITVTSEFNAETILQAAVFTPANNVIPIGVSSSNVTFHLTVKDTSSNLSSTNTWTLAISPVNDAPVITPGASPTHTIDDTNTTLVFDTATITDVDNSGTQPVLVTITLDSTAKGAFTTLNGFTDNTNNYTYSNAANTVSAAIQGMVFTPTPNRKPVGGTEMTTFTVSVDDDTASPVSSSVFKVTSTSVNDEPSMTGFTTNHISVRTRNVLTPMATLQLVDNDVLTVVPLVGETLTWSVTLTGTAPIGHLELSGSSGTSFSGTGSPSAASATLRSISYRAPTQDVIGTNQLALTILASDGHGGTGLSNQIILDLYTVTISPEITGTVAGQSVNDNSTVATFSTVSISSGNGNPVVASVSLVGVTNDDQGLLINLGSFTRLTSTTNTSVYVMTNSSEAITAAIRGLLFQPTPNRITGNSAELVSFSISVLDGTALRGPDTSTSVLVSPINDAPIIVGISPQVTINDDQTVKPFTTVSTADADELGLQRVTCTISLDVALKGSFSSNSLAASGFTTNGAGGFVLSTNAANLSLAIRQLDFIPTPNRVPVGLNEITTFTINLSDGLGGVAINSATSVRVTAVSGGPFITVPLQQPVPISISTNIFAMAGVIVTDPTTNVSVVVRLTDVALGSFTSNSLVASGFTNRGGGIYYFYGTATNATLALAQLDFVPAATLAQGATVGFTVSATNSLPNSKTVNHAVVLRAKPTVYLVTKLTDYDATATNLTASVTNGTLRNAVASAKNNDHISFDIRSTVADQPDYPATIRLVAPLVLDRNVTFDGPGAERLAINGDSDTNGVGDVQLFQINAGVTMNRLAFTKGFASEAGGAFSVSEYGDLVLSYCAISDSTAGVYGGGVDVYLGSLQMDHCLVLSNRTSAELGVGGGGVSLFTHWPCAFTHTAFATNRQNCSVGEGGGALYAENAEPGLEFAVDVLSCTFHDNRDAANRGTSIRPNRADTVIRIQNSIVADGQGKNLELDQSGSIISYGGNISDDNTISIFSQGGAVTNTICFHAPGDYRNIAATNLFSALANNGGPTFTYALTGTNVALGSAINVSNALFYGSLGTDQRGYHRDANPDIGAFERGASQRVVIQEIDFNPVAADNEFIEFCVPRDATVVNFLGFTVKVDGVLRHTFTSEVVLPGEAMVLLSTNTTVVLNSATHRQTNGATLNLDNLSGLIALYNPNGQLVYQANYVGAFTCTDTTNTDYLAIANQSIALSPPFIGVFLPYQRAVARDGGTDFVRLSNPGFAGNGTLLGVGNTPPLAYAETIATDAHTPLDPVDLLLNDVDLDATDTIRIVAVGPATNSTGASPNFSAAGARLIINNSPTTGASISYDPTASAIITRLPQGTNYVDSFAYSILDYSNGVANVRGSDATEIAKNLAKATAKVTVNIVGVNSAPTPAPDSLANSARLITPEDVMLDFTTVTNIIANDTDPNSDDDSNTLAIVAISDVNSYTPGRVSITTALGATATLDIRFDRRETHITYDPTGSAILNALNFGHTTNDTFYYSVADRYGAIGTSSITILVTGVDDSPIAYPNMFTTDEDTVTNLPTAALIANATDVDNSHTLHISAVTSPSALGATVTLVGASVIYNPTNSATLNALANKEFAADTFTYTVQDEFGLSSNAVATITVAGVNDHPISAHDAWSTDEETKFTTNAPGVLWNDIEPDINLLPPDDTFRVIPATNTTAGGVVMNFKADGSFSYDPTNLFDYLKFGTNTTETISYVVMDHSLSLANDDNFAVTATPTNNILPVLANDSILSHVGGVFTLISITTPNHGGTATLNASSNAIIYTPLAGYVGNETFSYTVADGLGWNDTAQVTISLAASTLFAVADNFTIARGTTNSLAVLLNDRLIPDTGAAVTVTALGTPSNGGSVALNGNSPGNTIEYIPSVSASTPFAETFTYTVTSGDLVAQGTVSLMVIDRAVTNAPVAKDDNFTVIATSGNNSLNVLANDLILPGPNTNLVITSVTNNSVGGTVSLNSARTRVLFHPATLTNNYTETNITYTISDNAGGSATAHLNVSVVPSGFIANDDTFIVVKNSTNTLPVMVNDVLLPNLGQTLFITGIGFTNNAQNHGGRVTINGAGTGLIYSPAVTNGGFVGQEDFTYEISDGSPARAVGHVHMLVLDYSAAPSNPDTFRVARDSANNALLVLPNDYIRPQTPGALRLTGLQTNGVHATITLSGTSTNNWVRYTPNLNFIGTDQFNYVFTDLFGNAGTNSVAVTVGDLAPRNDRFNVLSDSVTNLLDVRANDLIYPDTNTVRTIIAVGTPDSGGSAMTNSGATKIIYTPAASFVGTEHFTYTLKDDSANLFTATATVVVSRRGSDRDTNTMTMTVIGVNDIPTIVGSSNSAITDKQTVHPFATMVIGDLDEYNLQLQTATIVMDHLDNETLQNLGGFTESPAGTFTMSGTPPAITTALQGIIFAPVENHIIVPTTVTTHLNLTIDDHYITTLVTNLTTVAVTAVNDAPTTAGAGNYSITDKQTVNPFPTIVIADVDDDALQSQTVKIMLDHADNQTLTNLGGFTAVSSNLFTMTGTPTNITTALRGIVFVPTRNHITVPTTVTTRLTLTVNDAFAPVVTNAITTVAVTAINDTPTITGTTNYAITDKQTTHPFGSVTIADVDDDALQSQTVTIALDNLDNQTLTSLGGFTAVSSNLFTMTGTPTNLTTALRGIVFVPTPNHIIVPTTETTHLTLTVNDGFAPTVTDTVTTVAITAVNDDPTITNNLNRAITDKQTVQPFSTITVGDVDDDAVQPLAVYISMDHLDNGALQSLGGFTQTAPGQFEIYGTPAAITAALRGIVFAPVPNHIRVPTTETNHLTLFVDDGFILQFVTNLTTVAVTAVNDAPVISGTVAGQTVYSHSSIKPFVSALITEVDNDKTQALRITVTLDSAVKGALSTLGGFSDLGGGVYSYGVSNGTVTAAQATTALRGLVFTPTVASRVAPGTNEVTRFTIRVDDFFAPTVVDSNTTVVAIHPLTAKVTASDRTANAQFGWSVATTRDLAVVGAPRDLTGLGGGAVYLYTRSLDGSNTWTQFKKLVPADGHISDEFGYAVGISGDTIVVGARFTDEFGVNSGSAYVFARNQGGADQWGFVKKLLATGGAGNDQFGSAVSISGNVISVGAPFADAPASDSGAAFVFIQNQGGSNFWGQVKKLVSTDPAGSDHFGYSVAADGTNVLVGSPQADFVGRSDAGAAYLFSRNQDGAEQWGFVKKLASADGLAADNFGNAVAISGETIAVGAPLADITTLGDAGAAYVFSQNQGGSNVWGQLRKLTAPVPAISDRFGLALALSVNKLVVGAPLTDGSSADFGAAYLFAQHQGGSNTWGQVDKFLPAAVGFSDNFGCSVAVYRGTVVAGAYNGLDAGVRGGTAYMFRLKYNNAPLVVTPLVDQTVTPSTPLAYTVPAGTFSDPDVEDALTLGLDLGLAVPAWLNFDAISGAFSGTPNAIGNYPVGVVATDTDGASATNQFSIHVMAVPNIYCTLKMGAQVFGDNQFAVVTLNGVAGTTYRLQRTASLSGTVVWTEVASGTTDGGGEIIFYDSNPPSPMFYRAVWP